MPHMPKTPCKHPGCPELVPYGEKYCDKHKSLHPVKKRDFSGRLQGEDRKSAAKRGYDRRWQKARIAWLNSHPLCEECLKRGKYVKATVVDHIEPHRGNYNLFWDRNNWQSLCKKCHDRKTASGK